MKKLLVGLLVLGSFSAFAGVGNLLDNLEAKKCGKQLLKSYGKKSHDARYLYHLDSAPLIHVFAVYESQNAEPREVVKMVKHPGSKCSRY